MGLFSRMLGWPSTSKAVEGQYRDGPWFLPVTGGWLAPDAGKFWNWWQLGYDPIVAANAAMVEACVSAYAQTIAMLPGGHWRAEEDGGREMVENSALSRIMRRPNDYQTSSDFLLNIVRPLYLTGNAYALARRNDRFEIDSLHLMDPRLSRPLISERGEIFYELGGNELIDKRLDEHRPVPARDVLHIRLHTSRRTLIGESPLAAAALDVATAGAMSQQQLAFYMNQARPSTVLGTDHNFTKEQVDKLRELWNEQTRGLNAGGTPILTAGLKPMPLAQTAEQSQLFEMMKLTDEHIAEVFRIPLAVLGIGNNTYGSTETLMQAWIKSGLGFALGHIEEAFEKLFGLKGEPYEYLELDTKALLRSAQAEQIDRLVKGVQGGVYSPNEARAEVELGAVDNGDEPRVQQQVVPLSFGMDLPAPQPAPPAATPPADTPPPQEDATDGQASIDVAALLRRADQLALAA